MRNVKVKAIKKIALLSFAVFMLSAGITYAADDWSSFQREAESGTVNLDGNIQTDGTGINLGAPPVPSLTINGNGNTIEAGGSGATTSNYIINNQGGSTVVIHETNFTNANVSGVNGGNLSVTAQKVLTYIEKNNYVATSKKVEDLGISKRSIERAIKELRDKNLIRRVGSDKTGYYELNK